MPFAQSRHCLSVTFSLALAFIATSPVHGRGVVIDENKTIDFGSCTNAVCEVQLGFSVNFGAGAFNSVLVSERGLFAFGNADLTKTGTSSFSDFGQNIFSPAFANAPANNFLYRLPDPTAQNEPNSFKLRYDLNFDNNFTTVQYIIRPVGSDGSFELEYAYGDGRSAVDLGADTRIGYSFGGSGYEVLSGAPGINDRLNDQNNASFLFKFAASAPVPEPSSWALLLIGFAGAGFAARRNAGSVRLAGRA